MTYLGGPYVSQRRVLPTLVGLLHGIMMPSAVHGEFQRIITIDEVNLLEKLDAAWTAFTRAGRLVRHKGSTLILMGQDLNCVDDELFGLAELVFVFMLRNPRIWEHIRDRVGSLHGRRWSEVSTLQVAECHRGHEPLDRPGPAPGLRQAEDPPPALPARRLHQGDGVAIAPEKRRSGADRARSRAYREPHRGRPTPARRSEAATAFAV